MHGLFCFWSPHPEDAKAKESEYSDTEVAGLRIIVNRSGRKYFLFRYSFDSAKRSMKLGDYPQMDVANARQRALDCRHKVATGTDPQAAAAISAAARLRLREFVTNDYLPHAYATKRSAKDDDGRMRTAPAVLSKRTGPLDLLAGEFGRGSQAAERTSEENA